MKKALNILILTLVAVLFLFGCSKDKDKEEPCTHQNTTVAVTQAPTCLESGKQTTTCSDCGLVTETVLPALNHAWSKDQVSVAASCTQAGKNGYTCSHCNEKYTETVAQLTHEYVHSEADSVAPTCTTEGKYVQKCKNCGDTIEQKLYATGHNYVNEAGNVAKVCEARHCDNEGCTSELPAKQAHNYQLQSDTATCTEAGVKTSKCSLCQKKLEEASPAKGHNLNSEWTLTGNDTLDSGCVYNCERVANCSVCGEIKDTVKRTKHIYEFVVHQEATCTTPGKKAYKCKVCGELQPDTTPVEYTVDHNWGEGTTSDDYIEYACTKCDATKKTFTEKQADITKDDLAGNVQLGDATITMDSTAQDSITSENINLGAQALKKNELPSGTTGLDKLGDNDTIYNLTLTDNDGEITSFGGGYVTVRVPYTLSEGEDPASITIWYLSGTAVTPIEGAVYDNGYVTFKTDHFSYYTVGKYTTAEICEKFGHAWFTVKVDPTCTESGVDITYCTRCNAHGETYKPNIPATGHSYGAAANVTGVTCTTDGSETYTCTACNYSYTKITKATGHKWNVSKDEKATCTKVGALEQTCTECSASYAETIPQLPHNYKTSVVLSTCLTGGYTTYTCTTCEATHNGDATAPIGHKWNVAAPNCGVGQSCTVCGEQGKPATGEHVMAGSNCSVCGYGCIHVYQVKVSKPATCTEAGYNLYACALCGKEETRDYVKATGHTFTNNYNSCRTCKQTNPNLSASMKILLNSIASDTYSLKITNYSTEIVNFYPELETDNTETVSKTTVNIKDAYITFDDELILIYADIIATEFDKDHEAVEETHKLKLYGDGYYIYVETEGDNEENTYQRYAYKQILVDMEVQQILDSMGITLGDTITTNTPAQLFTTFVTGALGQELVDSWASAAEANEKLLYELAGKVFVTLFDGGNSNTTFTINLTALKTLNDRAYTMTVAQLVDSYYGEGTFEGLRQLLLSSETLTLNDVATKMLAYAESHDIKKADLYATINIIASIATGSEFDIEAMLKDPEFTSTTMGALAQQFIAGPKSDAFVYADYINELFNKIAPVVIYDMLELSDTEKVQFYNYINTFCQSGAASYTVTLDAEGKFAGLAIEYDNFKSDISSDYYSSGSNLKTETSSIVNGSISVDFNGSIPDDADDIAAKTEEMIKTVVDGLAKACNNTTSKIIQFSYWGYDTPCVIRFNVKNDGSLCMSIFAVRMEPGTNNPIRDTYGNMYADFSVCYFYTDDFYSLPSIKISENCKDTYRLGLDINIKVGEETQTLYIFGMYVNVKTGAFATQSCHNYVVDPNADIPSGTPTSRDDVGCEEYWFQYEKCTLCEKERVVHMWKSHSEYLKDPVVTEYPDGTTKTRTHEYYCTVCEITTYKYTTHYTENGRNEKEEHWSYDKDGNLEYHHYTRYEYSYTDGCKVRTYHWDFRMEAGKESYEGEREASHDYSESIPDMALAQTCSQYGYNVYKCNDCGKYVYSKYSGGHNLDYNTNTCRNCGLYVSNYDSSVVLEDLSNNDMYKRDNKLVIGFSLRYMYEYNTFGTPAIQFVKKDNTEITANASSVTGQFEVNTKLSALNVNTPTLFIIDSASVQEAANAAGISLEDYNLEILFPVASADPNYVGPTYSIVLTDIA